MRLFLDPAVAEVKPAGAPASPVAASPTPAAPPAAPAPATKTESASTPIAATADAAKPSPWMAPKVEDKKEPEKPAAAAPAAAPAATDKFDLKVPEGASMDAAALAKFESSMKELGFDAKQAQKILERDLAAQKASHEETISYIKAQDAAGLKELQSRWGTKFAERSETVKRAFEYADPTGEFRRKLEAGYLANNVDLVEFVEKFGALMKEDSIAAGPTAAKVGKDNRPLHERTVDAFREWNKKGK